MSARTLYDKLWESHVVEAREEGAALIYIDRHLVHEVTSPQAFQDLPDQQTAAPHLLQFSGGLPNDHRPAPTSTGHHRRSVGRALLLL